LMTSRDQRKKISQVATQASWLSHKI